MFTTLTLHDDSAVSLLSNGFKNYFLEHSKNKNETNLRAFRALRELGIENEFSDETKPCELSDLPILENRNGIFVLGNFLGLPTANKLAVMFTPKGYVMAFFGLTKDFLTVVREMKEQAREFVNSES